MSTTIIHFLTESAYLLITFSLFLSLAIFSGRQMLINVICGLYFALLITSQFPYVENLIGDLKRGGVIAVVNLTIFILITIGSTLLFKRLMPREFDEGRFESLKQKIALALGATILIMIFSFNVLPVTEFLTPGTPVQSFFAPQEYFFWWLILPLVILVWV